MHKKPVKMTIYINIYLYIFIMFMLCIYAHGTKSRTVHGQSIGQIHGLYQESPNTAVILHISYLRLSK